ncbi:leucine-rich repeat-containing protein 15-like [Branchiostoma lanceolatum]|uniref:leucine-rich repeat-containing protein 15-like n=1 Tax=Branchiostoma lanceolatum TaxID=7740 RepID=UPI003451743A
MNIPVVLFFLLVFCIPVDLQDGYSQVPTKQQPTLDGCVVERFADQTIVNCNGLGLTAIPHDVPPDTTVFDLSYNCIPVLKNDSFASLPHLKQLNVSHSCVHHIQTGAFNNVSHLKVLNLDYNDLKVLQKFSFSALHSLEKLLLSHNNLTAIDPESLHNLTNLKCLEVNHNGLNSLNNGSQIELWQGSLGRGCPFAMIGKLQTLLLHGNSIDAIDAQSFCGLFSLKSLDLSHNNITHIPNNSFADLKMLEKLNIADNFINDIEKDAFHSLSQLQDLHLQKNSLSFLHTETFYPCTNLKSLNISFNNLTKTVSKPTFHHLYHLKCLDLSHNKLEFACANLVMFQGLQQLEFLDISFTGDIWGHGNCSHTLQNLTNLVTLKLSYCGIGNIPSKAFENQKNLQYLDLSINILHSLPSDIFISCNSTNLNVNLKGNHIGSLQAGMFSLLHPALELDLSENDFFQVDSYTLIAFHNVSIINLSDNPFDCNCELVAFVEWANNHETQVAGWNDTDTVTDHYKCVNEKYKGKSLEDYSEYCPSKSPNSLKLTEIIVPSLAAVIIVVAFLLYTIKRYRDSRYQPIIRFNLEHQDYLYDLFIIHSTRDVQWVRVFSARLEEEGQYTVSYIERDFPGRFGNLLEAMDHFVKNSRTILGIITMNSLYNADDSGLCRHGLEIARQLEIEQGAHHQLKLIMLEDMDSMMNNLAQGDRCRVFSIIRGKTYLKWPEDGREEPQFWDGLKKIIGNPVVWQDEYAA